MGKKSVHLATEIYPIIRPNIRFIITMRSLFSTVYQQMLFFIFLSMGVLSHAQQTTPPETNGYWLVYIGDNKISEHFGLHTEVQMRNFFVSEAVSTKLFRFGVHYYLKPNAIFTAGYGYIYNTPAEEYLTASETREHRIWQQMIFRQKSRKFFLEHRYRLEQRFITNLNTEQSREEHRIRYRFQTIFPLYTIHPRLRHLFLTANNEIMLNFDSNPGVIFDRNRLYAGLGYQVSPKLNFQLGYLNQFAQLPAQQSTVTDHLIQCSVSYNLDDIMPGLFRKTPEPNTPY
jgi:hypothetical protein